MTLSVSKVRAWLTCRLMWWFRYVVRTVPPNVEPWHLTRGTAVHAALATAYGLAAAERIPPPRGTRMSRYEEQALETLQAELPADLAAQDRFETVGAVVALLDRLPVPAPAAILGVEKPFRFATPAGQIEGVLDLALRTGPDRLHIRDWKWSITPEADSQQGATYVAAALALWPWARHVTIGFYSIKHQIEQPLELPEEMINFRLDEIQYAGLEMADALVADEPPAQTFPATLGEHCASCLFRAYCPAYKGPEAPLTFAPEDVESTRTDLMRKLSPL